MYVIMFVLDDPDYLDQVLEAWEGLGVSGATVIESSGLHRLRTGHIPMRYTYGEAPLEESGNCTLFVIVASEKLVRACLEAVEGIVGGLDQPNTGVFTAWPVLFTKGVPERPAE